MPRRLAPNLRHRFLLLAAFTNPKNVHHDADNGSEERDSADDDAGDGAAADVVPAV